MYKLLCLNFLIASVLANPYPKAQYELDAVNRDGELGKTLEQTICNSKHKADFEDLNGCFKAICSDDGILLGNPWECINKKKENAGEPNHYSNELEDHIWEGHIDRPVDHKENEKTQEELKSELKKCKALFGNKNFNTVAAKNGLCYECTCENTLKDIKCSKKVDCADSDTNFW